MSAERIPQSQTIRIPLKAYLSADHITEATGLTIAVQISKNNAAFANPSAGATNATETADGWYYVDLSTTDTDTLGPLIVRGTEGTIDPTEYLARVELDPASDVWEALQADHLTAGSMGAAMANLTAQIAVAIANILVLSTFNPATDTVDGITYESALEAILAATCNVGVPSGATQVWMKIDGTTPKVTVTLGGTPGERTSSVIS